MPHDFIAQATQQINMTLAYDIVVGGVVTMLMFILHRISVELLAPGSKLWAIATTDTAVMDGTRHATTMFEVVAVWMPVLFIAGIWTWVLIRAYKRQVQTAIPVR
jgi:hypothetical protein